MGCGGSVCGCIRLGMIVWWLLGLGLWFMVVIKSSLLFKDLIAWKKNYLLFLF
jgi:hypothetical protein